MPSATRHQRPTRHRRPTQRLLDTAAQLFARHGIDATGIDRILAEAGVAKMTLYNNFGSKDAFVLAVLEREAAAWRDWFAGALAALPGGPKERIVGMFGVLGDWFEQAGFYGCPVMNALAGTDKDSPRIRSLAEAHEAMLLSTVRDLVTGLDVGESGGDSGHDGLASMLLLLVRGAIVQATLCRTAEPARTAAEAARLLLSRM
jgi:AcrR family transcriptional regulator